MEKIHLEIIGTGAYLPEKIVKNEDFKGRTLYKYDILGNRISEGKEVTPEKIFEMSGILERRYAGPNETPSSMGTLAAIKAIDDSGINPNSLVGIILATVTENSNFPSGACKIQQSIGDHYKTQIDDCIAYDVGAACAGFVMGMGIANSMVSQMKGNYLVVGADDIPGVTQDDDQNKFLFGAGAGATILTPTTSERGIKGWKSSSNPYNDKLNLIMQDDKNFLRMPEGGKVMKRAIGSMIDISKKLKEEVGWDRADVYVPHQANKRILDGMARKLDGEGSLVYQNIEKTGNSSAATCPIALDKAKREGIINDGDKVIVVAFGSGLVTSAVALQF